MPHLTAEPLHADSEGLAYLAGVLGRASILAERSPESPSTCTPGQAAHEVASSWDVAGGADTNAPRAMLRGPESASLSMLVRPALGFVLSNAMLLALAMALAAE